MAISVQELVSQEPNRGTIQRTAGESAQGTKRRADGSVQGLETGSARRPTQTQRRAAQFNRTLPRRPAGPQYEQATPRAHPFDPRWFASLPPERREEFLGGKDFQFLKNLPRVYPELRDLVERSPAAKNVRVGHLLALDSRDATNRACYVCESMKGPEEFDCNEPAEAVKYPDGRMRKRKREEKVVRAPLEVVQLRRFCMACGALHGIYPTDKQIKSLTNVSHWVCECKMVHAIPQQGPTLGQARCDGCNRVSPLRDIEEE